MDRWKLDVTDISIPAQELTDSDVHGRRFPPSSPFPQSLLFPGTDPSVFVSDSSACLKKQLPRTLILLASTLFHIPIPGRWRMASESWLLFSNADSLMLTTMNFNISEVKYSACAPLYPFPSFQKSGKFEMGSRDRETSELVPAIPREFLCCFM